MINILNLPEYNVINVQETVDAYRIEVEVAKQPLYFQSARSNTFAFRRTALALGDPQPIE
jgi:hypothetical protein